MAQAILVNVYEINDGGVKTPFAVGIPVAGSRYTPYKGARTNLYGIVTYGRTKYAVVESVSALVAKANA